MARAPWPLGPMAMALVWPGHKALCCFHTRNTFPRARIQGFPPGVLKNHPLGALGPHGAHGALGPHGAHGALWAPWGPTWTHSVGPYWALRAHVALVLGTGFADIIIIFRAAGADDDAFDNVPWLQGKVLHEVL